MESSLPDGVHASISALLDLLEQKHGPSLVRRCLSYLTLSRTGLTEAELTDLLSSDDDMLMMAEYLLRGGAHPSKLRVPHVDVERLLLDLRVFLGRRTVAAGTGVLFWTCRHFGLVVTKKYLGCHQLRKKLHSVMADYFNGLWAFGNAKPLIVMREPESRKQLGSSESNASFSETGQTVVYIDRQLPCQPFVFRSSDSLSSACKEVGLVNLRMILELPHHLQESERWEELERKLLLSLGFQQAMAQAGLLGDLVAMLKGERGSHVVTLPRERALLASMLKSTACVLQSSPQELPMLMETGLLPYVGVYPQLGVYIQEIQHERRRGGSSISVVLCPASSILPSNEYSWGEVTREQGLISEVAVTACDVLVGVMESGFAWMWRSPWREVEELSLSNKQLKVKFSGVRSTGSRILLSTCCNTLFLLDVTGPEVFVEVQGQLKMESEGETDQHTHTVEGCVESGEHLCVWWKDKDFACVFRGANDRALTFQCESTVTCLVCSTDGRYMYCGQEAGVVSIFDLYTLNTQLVCECSNPNQTAVLSIILCEEKWDMACVDITGNIILWNVDGGQSQPAFCSAKSGTSIINIDHSAELATLLVCKAQQITVWNTSEWVPFGQFTPPQGKAFLHALLAQEGHLFLALLQSCSLVLVWRISSGECLVSLDTSSSAPVPRLLKTASGFITIAPHGRLSLWDSAVIYAAAVTPKMSSGVRQVVADEVGERFYTADGSVEVWGWSLRTGEPEVNFFHDGLVEKLALSPDNCHLVTVSGGDIYVWGLDTCQNSFRISGSGATDVLVTPSSKFAVSLCEGGLSRVWNLQKGGVVCNIHLSLTAAKVSPESTFLFGLCRGDLLAVSLWSGYVSKRFSQAGCIEHVVAFHMLPQQPDFVLVTGSSGMVYTWNVTENSVVQQFQLPRSFSGRPQMVQTSSAGSFALLSASDDTVAFLDLSAHRVCSVKVEGAGFAVCPDRAGRYAVCLSQPSAQTAQCSCDVHLKAVLTVIRLADGGKVGTLRLRKTPSALAVCEQLCVYVGFHDGSVGVYSILDIVKEPECSVKGGANVIGLTNQCLCSIAPKRLLPLASPNVTWS